MEILTNMPKRNGKENKINWKESIGLDIEILYKNEKFKIYIKDYK